MAIETVTRTVSAYKRGRPSQIQVVKVESNGRTFWMEANTAEAFEAMRRRAEEDGIDLVVSSAFRSMGEQRRLWNKRLDEDGNVDQSIVDEIGMAARPGYSNHQSGVAIDIRTGMSAGQFARGKRTPVYEWLEDNAADFGFERTVPKEPWHWVRTETFTPAVRAFSGGLFTILVTAGLAWWFMKNQ